MVIGILPYYLENFTISKNSLKNSKFFLLICFQDNSYPLFTFECNGDYVYDVSWSPTHSGIFACVDGTGTLDIWNLNKSFEQPSCSFNVDNCNRALNKLKWSLNGHEIIVGDDLGNISKLLLKTVIFSGMRNLTLC